MNKSYSNIVPQAIEVLNPKLGKYLVRFDIKEKEGSYEYIEKVYLHKPTLEEIKILIQKYYNLLCDKEILSGLKYENSTVWLSSENQFNYKAAYDFCFQKQVMSLPFESPTFKLGMDDAPVYKTFEDMEELTTFIQACFGHIQNTLAYYWNIKDSINWNNYIITE